MYLLLRHLHITCAVLSVSGFALRGALWLAGSHFPKRPWVRRVTDANDALLLLAAIGLAIVTHQYPFQQNWLTAKLLALLVYIALGLTLFRYSRSRMGRFLAWLSALVTAGYIVSVAMSKNPYGFLAHWLS